MRLERLEINGFKSFSDRSELAFDEGVTAIVGPNGCGKSNVADAITWVLGEQSAKSLRGDKMEDVIFNGSDARKPGGAAEVRLRLGGLPLPALPKPDSPAPNLQGLQPFHAPIGQLSTDVAQPPLEQIVDTVDPRNQPGLRAAAPGALAEPHMQLAVLAEVRRRAPTQLAIRAQEFDRLAAGAGIREAIERGDDSDAAADRTLGPALDFRTATQRFRRYR